MKAFHLKAFHAPDLRREAADLLLWQKIYAAHTFGEGPRLPCSQGRHAAYGFMPPTVAGNI